LEHLILLAIISCLSAIQSVIGVGLLVFGTPTFLLLGRSFPETLGIVLPPSILISLIQVLTGPRSTLHFRREFNVFALPFSLIGVFLTLTLLDSVDLRYPVAIMLLVSGVIRFLPTLEGTCRAWIVSYRKPYQVLLGSIHGLTNMGGGLLTLYSASLYPHDKARTRAAIAYGYLLMGLLQYSALVFVRPTVLSINVVYVVAIAGVTYILLGRLLFSATTEKSFHALVTSMILAYGVLLLFR
jgi:uncharacterized membrane protein YfcA